MKTEYINQVADKIIEQLEKGVAPWQVPWNAGELRLPYNPSTGKEYRGMNSMWLHMQGHSDPRWMTYKQAVAEGAQVRKGSKGTHIVYWKFSEEKKLTDEHGNPVIDEITGKQKTVTVQLERPRSFLAVVFNGSQIDGLPPIEARPIGEEPERHARAEAILANSGAKIQHQYGNNAFYRPSADSITLPERSQFSSSDRYYATALHELGHWTGHPSRLDRDLMHPFGSEGYAREELRAEIASLMLGERLDIGHDPEQHIAYVGSWIKALKKDPKEIFRAAADAERITSYVMGFEKEQIAELLPEQSEAIAYQGQSNTTSVLATEQGQGLAIDQTPTHTVLHEQPENPVQSRTYLAVPYIEKNEAKALGAKWDKNAKSWYAPEGINIDESGLSKWLIDANTVIYKSAVEQFKDALIDAGLKVTSEIQTDGELHRLPVDGDSGSERSGAYAYHESGYTPGGYIQNYKTGEIINWKPEQNTSINKLSEEEKKELIKRAEIERKERELLIANKHEKAAMAAQALWDEALPATENNAYCKAKNITPIGLKIVPESVSEKALSNGVRIAKTVKEANELREQYPDDKVFKSGDLLIPGVDANGKLWTLQSVNPYFKAFIKGSKKHGVFTIIGADNLSEISKNENAPYIISEGYATGNSVSKLSGGDPVIVAFDSGNLLAVAKQLREISPDKQILFASDNDHLAEGKIDKNGNPRVNVGLLKSYEAAEIVGGGVITPKFLPGQEGSDWNDIEHIHGVEDAKKMFLSELSLAKRDAAVNFEKTLSCARDREMNARNNPETSIDDADIAKERDQAANMINSAQGFMQNVNGAIANAKSVGVNNIHSSSLSSNGGDKINKEVKDWAVMSEQEKISIVNKAKNGVSVDIPKDAPDKLKKIAGRKINKAEQEVDI